MYDVISIGTATRDVFLMSPFFKVLRDPGHLEKLGFPTGEAECFALGSKIDIERIALTTGGGATNTAVTFGRQGFNAAALVTIGDDPIGKEVVAELERERVAPLAIINRGDITAYSTILLSESGERTILSYRNPDDNLREGTIPFEKLKTAWAYLAPGTIDLATLARLIDVLHAQGARIAINPSMHFIRYGVAAVAPLLARVSVLIVNREEGAALTGIDYRDEREIFKRLSGLVSGVVVMTDGPRGASVCDRATVWRAGIFKEERVVDRTGAGDAFGSGFVAGLIQRRETCEGGKCGADNIAYAIRLGSANGTKTVEVIGAKAGLLTKEQFEADDRWKTLTIVSEKL